MKIIRVFPKRTHQTPTDNYAFIGDPPMIRPPADEVHVSVSFTWDIAEGLRLKRAWQQYYPVVKIGGLPFGDYNGEFTPGLYVKHGVTFTTRGCDRQCPWCLVPKFEGKFREIEVKAGNIVEDNNLLMANRTHLYKVFEMLRKQPRATVLSGGLDSELITDWVADQIKTLRIDQIFLAADHKGALPSLEKAVKKLQLPRRKMRCFVLLGYGGERLEQALERLINVWNIGCLPFAQLYQPPDKYIKYPQSWRDLARTWSRPPAMLAEMREK